MTAGFPLLSVFSCLTAFTNSSISDGVSPDTPAGLIGECKDGIFQKERRDMRRELTMFTRGAKYRRMMEYGI